MICGDCREAADLLWAANTGNEYEFSAPPLTPVDAVLDDLLLAEVDRLHKLCKGVTHCTCQHKGLAGTTRERVRTNQNG